MDHIKSLSSSSYQLIEDYVTYYICSRSTSGVKVSKVIVCTKSSRIALEYVRFKLIKRSKSTSGFRSGSLAFQSLAILLK